MQKRNLDKLPVEVRNERTELVPIESIQCHPRNPNEGDVEEIAQSLLRFGFVNSLTVQISTRHILSGNHTYKAACFLGMRNVPVTFVDMPDKEAEAFMLAANQIARKANYNDVLLVELLREQAAEPDGFTGTGFDSDMLAELMRATEEYPTPTVSVPDSGGEGSGSGSASLPGEKLVKLPVKLTADEEREIMEELDRFVEEGTFSTHGAALLYCVRSGVKDHNYSRTA